MTPALQHPRGSKVSTDELLREVEEYFSVGASVSKGDTVVDVGANVGAFSMSVAQRCEGEVRLLCFEPSPDTCEVLRQNFKEQPTLAKTTHAIFDMGLSSGESAGSELTFYSFRRYPTNSTFDLATKRREIEIFFEDRGRRLRERLSGALSGVGRALESVISSLPKGKVGWWAAQKVMGIEETRVRVGTLAEVLRSEKIDRVDLLKIDVEGFELDVLRGLSSETWPCIRQVVMETSGAPERREPIEAILRANGLTEIRAVRQTTIDNGLDSVLLLATRPG